MSNKVTKTFNCKRKFKVNSSEPLDSDEISVQVGSNNKSTSSINTSEPNPLALAILWAHFQAYQQDLLTKDKVAPWEKIQEQDISTPEEKLWFQFLQNVVSDNLANWIHNPQEVRERSIEAYNQIETDIESDNVETDNNKQATETCSIEQTLTVQCNLVAEAEVKSLNITCSVDSNN